MVRQFHIGPLLTRLRAEDTRASSTVDGVYRYLHADSAEESAPAKVDVTVAVGRAVGDPPADAAVIGTFDNGFRLWREGEDVVFGGEGYRAVLDVKRSRGRVVVPEVTSKAQRWIGCAVVLQSLTVLFRSHRLYALHAATLVRDGRGLVVAASADSGKSTLALRLVQSGWDYLSDDTVLLRPGVERVDVAGLRSHFGLDPEAEGIFPELTAGRKASLMDTEKWAINVEALYPAQRVASCVPHVLLFPQIVDADVSRVQQISQPEALRLLLAQSSLARVKLEGTREHLDTLARVVQQTRTYRLHSGRDLLHDAARADALLAPLLKDTSS